MSKLTVANAREVEVYRAEEVFLKVLASRVHSITGVRAAFGSRDGFEGRGLAFDRTDGRARGSAAAAALYTQHSTSQGRIRANYDINIMRFLREFTSLFENALSAHLRLDLQYF